MELFCQIYHQVCWYTIKRHPLKNFITYKHHTVHVPGGTSAKIIQTLPRILQEKYTARRKKNIQQEEWIRGTLIYTEQYYISYMHRDLTDLQWRNKLSISQFLILTQAFPWDRQYHLLCSHPSHLLDLSLLILQPSQQMWCWPVCWPQGLTCSFLYRCGIA